MAVSRRRFRPMGFSEIIDEAFDLYKSNFVLLVGIAACLYVPTSLLSGLGAGEGLAKFKFPSFTAAPDPHPFSNLAISPYQIISMVLVVLLSPIVIGAVTHAISRRYNGEPVGVADAYGYVWRNLPSFLLTAALFFLTTVPILVLLVAPWIAFIVLAARGYDPVVMGIMALVALLLSPGLLLLLGLLYSRLLFVFPVFVAEGRRYFDCLSRAWTLSAGFMWRTLGILVLANVVIAIIQSIIVSPFTFAGIAMASHGWVLPAGLLIGVVDAGVETALAPIISLIVVLLYFDLRIRKEGFDLEMLAKELAGPGGEALLEGADEITTVIDAQPAESRCTHCSYPIYRAEDGVVCPTCGAALHLSCWQQNGGCSTPGCAANQQTAGSQQT